VALSSAGHAGALEGDAGAVEEEATVRESWVHPVTDGHEAPPAWRAVWRFRLTALALLAVAVLLGVLAYQALRGQYDDVPTGPGLPRALPPAVTTTGSAHVAVPLWVRDEQYRGSSGLLA